MDPRAKQPYEPFQRPQACFSCGSRRLRINLHRDPVFRCTHCGEQNGVRARPIWSAVTRGIRHGAPGAT